MLKAEFRRLVIMECDASHPITRSDIEWFRQHPQRTHRGRKPFHGEVEALAGPDAVPIPIGARGQRIIIMQWAPGDLGKIATDWNEEHEIEGEDDSVLETLFVAAWMQVPVTRAQVVAFAGKLRPDETVKH